MAKQSELEKFVEEHNISEKDILNLAKATTQRNPFERKDFRVGKSNIKFGLMGDTHIGNINYDKDLMRFATQTFTKEKVDFVVHGGDVVDGWYQNRPLQIFESEAIGFDAQVKLAVEELSQINQPLYFITGNHEENTYKRNAGIELGETLEDKLKSKGLEAKFLGNAEADIVLKNGTRYKIMHPDGGTAYAISYRPQKIIESLSGGEKPNILSIHHFHKAEYLFHRNIHAIQAGTLEGQTQFMRGKHIPAHKGFWIIELNTREDGWIDRIKPEFYPSYD